jgi:hypothetical protein
MKFITANAGVSVIRMAADDFAPLNGIPVSDLEASLISTYKCTKNFIPQMPGASGLPSIWLQNGHLDVDGEKLAIQFLLLFPSGLWVSTPSTTENADKVMASVIDKLDSEFGFKIATSTKEQYWTSNIVVEFAKGIEQLSDDLEKIARIINRANPRASNLAARLQFRRFGFGYDGHDEDVSTFDNIEWTGFSIERRVKTSYELNRFFCAAGLKTTAHIEALQAIEDALNK